MRVCVSVLLHGCNGAWMYRLVRMMMICECMNASEGGSRDGVCMRKVRECELEVMWYVVGGRHDVMMVV